jgi:hypothetical protein
VGGQVDILEGNLQPDARRAEVGKGALTGTDLPLLNPPLFLAVAEGQELTEVEIEGRTHERLARRDGIPGPEGGLGQLLMLGARGGPCRTPVLPAADPQEDLLDVVVVRAGCQEPGKPVADRLADSFFLVHRLFCGHAYPVFSKWKFRSIY